MSEDKIDYWDVINMDEDQIDIFLEEKTLGVLSLSKDDQPYGIPLCYVHDEDTDTIYFNFGEHEHSRKLEYIDANPRASFTVYDRSPGAHLRSVIVEGTVTEVTDEEERDLARELLLRRHCSAPLYFWGVASKDLSFPFYKLEIEEKYGRDSELEWPDAVKDRIRSMLE